MLYLVAIFVPPLYFIAKKKWLAATVTSFLFVVSVCTWITIPILWPICAISAVWDLRKALMKEQAELIAQKMVAGLRQQPPTAK